MRVMPRRRALKKGLLSALEQIRIDFGPRVLESDPVRYVHRFEARKDREVAGYVASALAFGRVRSIFASLDAVFTALGPSPEEAIRSLPEEVILKRLGGFRHRWIAASDLASVLAALGRAIVEEGNLEAVFLTRGSERRDAQTVLSAFSRRIRGDLRDRTRGMDFLLSDPESGGACKRQNLFLRWMVRPADGVDLGLWTLLSPADLVMPVDTHIAFLARALGLSSRTTADWKMALEVTDRFREVVPTDPLKYDWALTRLGILGHCPKRRCKVKCRPCPLFDHCRLGREARKERVDAALA